jgi:hypothetical protein
MSDNGVELSKMGERMFTMKSEVVGHFVQSVDRKIRERWRFNNFRTFRVNFQKIHAFFSTALSQLR